MDITAYRDEIKLKLTGNLLDLELDDATLDLIINSAFRELQRYIDTTRLVTIPYKPCIDLTELGVNSVARVFRSKGYGVLDSSVTADGAVTDPMYLAQWQVFSGNGNLYNINDWVYNYAAWNTALQVRNTLSTDLLFRFDRDTSKLYINCTYDSPDYITVEYVPRYNDVSEIKSDFWIDMEINLATALAKVAVGRIRSRFTQTNALWQGDGERLVEEGNAELANIREKLIQSTQLCYPVD